MLSLAEEDGDLLVWWGTPVEITSALARREREGDLSDADLSAAFATLRELAESWHEVVPTDAVRRMAERLLRTHPLRAADSLQLAAALIVADHDAGTLDFVCLDDRLSAAARREGFTVLDG